MKHPRKKKVRGCAACTPWNFITPPPPPPHNNKKLLKCAEKAIILIGLLFFACHLAISIPAAPFLTSFLCLSAQQQHPRLEVRTFFSGAAPRLAVKTFLLFFLACQHLRSKIVPKPGPCHSAEIEVYV